MPALKELQQAFVWYDFLTWNMDVELPPAPALLAPALPARPPSMTLMDILRMPEADVWMKNTIHFRNARVCKEWKRFAYALRRFFFLVFYLNDNQGRLSWNRFQAARDALTARVGLDVLELHAFHMMLGKDFNKQPREKSRFFLWEGEVNSRLCKVYTWKNAVINDNRLVMKVFGYAFRTERYSSYDSRYAGNGMIEAGPFPKLEKVAFNNVFHFTGVMNILLGCMPNVKHVKIDGGLDMTEADATYSSVPAPSVLVGVSAALPACLKELDISTMHASKSYQRLLFATAFARAAEQGHFARLKVINMENTFATMRKAEGELFLQAFKHCKKLRKVVVGDKSRLKEWHLQAVVRLIDSRGRRFRVVYKQ